jgi:hypothetical protein
MFWKVWKIWYFLCACVLGRAAGPAGSGSYIPSPRGRGGGGYALSALCEALQKSFIYINACPTRRHRKLKRPPARPFGPRSPRLPAPRGHPTGRSMRPCERSLRVP